MTNNDYLSRQPYINLLKSIIKNQCDNPTGYSFAIDGKWGCGKTWVLNELEEQLLKDASNKCLIFHYNAWKNDFYDEPLVAILSVMIERLEKICKGEETINNLNAKLSSTALAIFKNLAISFVNTTVKNKIGIDFRDVIEDFEKVKDIKSELRELENQIDNSLPLKKGINEIRNQLRELAKDVTILFIVDELDRCLPEYAIKVLERLHHICNEMPVIQIIAINKNHLSDSIVKVFGKDYSSTDNLVAWNQHFAESYLQKFVDTIIPLSNGKLDNKLEVLKGLEKEFEPYTRDSIDQKDFIKLDDVFLTTFISKVFTGMERREQEKIISLTALCHKLTIAAGIELEIFSYAILIYEIISCICRYVFHLKDTCKLYVGSDKYQLEFFQGMVSFQNPDKKDNTALNENLRDFFSSSVNYDEYSGTHRRFAFEICDTKTYVMAYFYKKEIKFDDPLQNDFWEWIEEDKVFLKKFDEIMNTLVV